ncbi:MAG: ADP-ribosylglycohydrolase family protein [Clostridia bacterium]|nr:ADP-ribosylglycohydrolase family protein [Clostridia bacterium]
MLGAVVGDVVGSVYEFNNIKSKKFPLFGPKCRFTDDSVMTMANALAGIEYIQQNRSVEFFTSKLIQEMKRLGKQYPRVGYGGEFRKWLFSKVSLPYQSYGNGSAMRVSPVAWIAQSLEETEYLAEASASVTHNHSEGIKGAKATAGAIYLARTGSSKEAICDYIQLNYYSLDFTLEQIRPQYQFDVSCQGSVPQAIKAFLEGRDFEDAIRNAISLGGDSDTIGAITGSIAEAFWGIPEDIANKARSYLTPELQGVEKRFALAIEKVN